MTCTDVQRHHVFVLGEHPDTCDLYRDILEGEGYRVSHAAVAEWELTLSDTQPPCLILLDLPFSDEIAATMFLARLSAASLAAAVPLLVCSTQHTLLATWCAQLSAHGGGTLRKPFNLQELLIAVWASVTARER